MWEWTDWRLYSCFCPVCTRIYSNNTVMWGNGWQGIMFDNLLAASSCFSHLHRGCRPYTFWTKEDTKGVIMMAILALNHRLCHIDLVQERLWLFQPRTETKYYFVFVTRDTTSGITGPGKAKSVSFKIPFHRVRSEKWGGGWDYYGLTKAQHSMGPFIMPAWSV